ncbi:glycoside hydrolase family 9 protein [Sphingomonas sp. CJ99]
MTTLTGSGAAQDGQAPDAGLRLSERGYLTADGFDVIVFDDIYPDGHQTGVTIIQQGRRVAANGDVRLDAMPGQWSPMPKGGERSVDAASRSITQRLSFPDPGKNGRGFNPIFYPPVDLSYAVTVTPAGGNRFRIRVDLDKPLPREWVGRAGFNLELFPTDLFGKAWLMDKTGGIFPRQPNGPIVRQTGPTVPVPRNMEANGPVQDPNGQALGAPLARGRKLVVAPETQGQRIVIEGTTDIELIDGRSAHNNGWFIVRGVLPAGKTARALEWTVTVDSQPDWQSAPVIQVSQVGYAPAQSKRALFELDARSGGAGEAVLYRLTERGEEAVLRSMPAEWGKFLRYRYLAFDFTSVTEEGMYRIGYGDQRSQPFRIATDVYARDVWQPTLETFLPVQMCHMRVSQKYRVWHGHDHLDDARMAPVGLNHFDGYVQGPDTLTRFQPGQAVPGLNSGGWHDAGDYDLRVESQMGTVWLLAKMVEEFDLDYDATRIDPQAKTVEIHDPDGRNDAIQQIEHGLASVLGGYRSLGRLYRGIITPSLRRYVMLGDAGSHSDNVPMQPVAGLGVDANGTPVTSDDRWVFTEDNPERELHAAAGLAGAARALKRDNPALAAEALAAARAITDAAIDRGGDSPNRIFALAELALATGEQRYVDRIVALSDLVLKDISKTGWMLSGLRDRFPAAFRSQLDAAVRDYQAKVKADARTDSPYGIPYKPQIWGAGWDIQRRGVEQWLFAKGWPDAVDPDSWLNALNFVLGVHPGENTASFVSGVGSHSATVAYGVNRADWSYIPGGVISGTNLIRPDLPELKVWPYFWQQTEYVMGGGETNFMFLALAADRHFAGKPRR